MAYANPHKQDPLNPRYVAFIEAYLHNGFDATKAYSVVHPGANQQSCQNRGPRYRALLRDQIDAAVKAMWGDKIEQITDKMIDSTSKVIDDTDHKHWPTAVKTALKLSGLEKTRVELTGKDGGKIEMSDERVDEILERLDDTE